MSKINEWFTIFQKVKNPCMRIFCFHYAGGSASFFRHWSQDLIPGVELVAIQLPGRENRFTEDLFYNLLDVANAISLNFKYYSDKPFVFFGHSVGALLSFEVARCLRRKIDIQPKHLMVSGTTPPHVRLRKKQSHKLSKELFVQELQKYNNIPSIILNDKELMDIFLPTIRADFCISETYNYINENPLNCPITALGGQNDNTFDKNLLIKWKEQTNNEFNYYFLEGDHFFVNVSYLKLIKLINQILQNLIKKC